MTFLLVAVLGVSCSSSTPRSPWVNYTEAMSKVKTAKTAQGVPRSKMFYHFRLMMVPSKRGLHGVRNGYASNWEQWNLPDGCILSAWKHWRAIFKIDPVKNESSGESSLFRIDEKYYQEPRLEPYFDTLILTDQKKHVLARIDLPFS